MSAAEPRSQYMRQIDEPIAETLEVYPNVMVDLSADGQVVGIEYLGRNASPEHRESRIAGYRFSSSQDKTAWEEQKKLMDDLYEEEHGDFSMTDINSASEPSKPSND
jgi:uncharacterized protein YuzE